MTNPDLQRFCSICAHEINSSKCPHPWRASFDEWPKDLLDKLRAMLPSGPSKGS